MGQALEFRRIEGARFDLECVARRSGVQSARSGPSEHLPQLGDMDLDRIGGGLGGFVTPDRLDQTVTRDRPSSLEKQGTEDDAVDPAPHGNRRAVGGENLERAQNQVAQCSNPRFLVLIGAQPIGL
jgi:hypothetical protein